jgi:hypothetical protein
MALLAWARLQSIRRRPSGLTAPWGQPARADGTVGDCSPVLDLQIEEGQVKAYRAKVRLSLKVGGRRLTNMRVPT